MADQNPKTVIAAYLPFKTFISAIEALEHGLPSKLDRTIWRQSGIVQGQIMMAFRFFGLLNSSDEPTPALHKLVENKENRPQQIAALLRHSFGELLDKDLTKMTPRILDDEMARYGVQGDTRRKAIAFFLRAAKFADLPMHPLLASQMRNTSTGAKRKRRNGIAESKAQSSQVEESHSAGTGTVKSVVLPSGTKITIDIQANWLDMPTAERDFVFGLIDKLHTAPTSDAALDEEEEADDE